MDDDADRTADIAKLEFAHKKLVTLAAAQDTLIAKLEQARKKSKNEMALSQIETPKAIHDYLGAQDIPPGSLLLLLELVIEMEDELGGNKKKPLMEALRLAIASAAVTLARDAGEVIGTVRADEAGLTARKAARILGGDWTGKKLITHRDNLINGHSRAEAIGFYESHLDEAPSWTDLTAQQKVDRMLGYLRAIT